MTEEETALRDSAARFAQEVVAPRVRSMDEASQFDPDVIAGLFKQGFMGIEIPEALGGSGMGFLSACLAVEEIAYVDPSVAVCVDVQNTLVNNIFGMFGNEALRERFWTRLARDSVGSFALSETGSGSDAFALKTRAERSGDYYVINGSKAWITNGAEAVSILRASAGNSVFASNIPPFALDQSQSVFLVFATVDSSKGYKGITCFAVDKQEAGSALVIGKVSACLHNRQVTYGSRSV